MSEPHGIKDKYVLLDGHSPLADFVRFMKRTSEEGHRLSDVTLMRQWQEANRRVKELTVREAGWGDTPNPPELPAAAAAFGDAELQGSIEQSSLAFLPHRWAMVELDRLVVYQKFINVSFAQEIERSLPERPTQDQLIRIAAGGMRELPPIHVTQIDGNAFSFVSASNDLRVVRVAPFKAHNLSDEVFKHNASSVLGVFVGYGSNLLQAVRIGNRTILTNGSHRAYALRLKGLTHVPCILQYAKEDELDLLGMPDARQHIERYMTVKRPPLFKDYFDENLYRTVQVPRRSLMLQVELTVRQSFVPLC